jgi:hypothetical protein
MNSIEAIIHRFDINPTHSLMQQNRQQLERSGKHYDTCWYVEKNAAQEIVARYRSWTNQALQPPFRSQIGWERYSPGGTLLEREVRYAELPNADQLH